MRKTLRILSALALIFTEAACGDLLPRSYSDPPVPQMHSMDGVKLISPAIGHNNDPSSQGQLTYQITASKRLLLRFEDFESHVGKVRYTNDSKVQIQVTLIEPSSSSSLQLCPLTRNWMMLATWDRAHPFGDLGKWARSGGDFEEIECVPSSKPEESSLSFDITPWFLNYAKGRGSNNGFVLISENPMTIYGESSPRSSPRLLWEE